MEYSDLTWLAPGDPFPSVARTGGAHSIAPGLLAAGGLLDMPTLKSAYSRGIFPWFSEGQPVLWWSPDPRMVLKVDDFRIHRSLRKTLQRFQASTGCEIRFDTDFATVIRNCAQAPRVKQKGTWILPSMVAAYIDMHEAGLAHSVETWVDGSLVAGLYCVAIGQAVFGESMFTTVPDGSKIALAALVAFCKFHGIAQFDCQQATPHLARMGATPIARMDFLVAMEAAQLKPPPIWRFDPLYWNALLAPAP